MSPATTEKPPTITEALVKVMEQVGAVGKGDWNDHQKFKFRGIDAVINACSPAFRAIGVVVVPDVQSYSYDVVQTNTGKPSTACRVHVAYTFFGPAGDFVRTTVIGEAWDSGDKATPKAMSVAYRTALLQTLALPTDEPDPDSHTYVRDNEPAAAPPQPPAEKWAEFCTAIDACADNDSLTELRLRWNRLGILEIPYTAEGGVTLDQKIGARREALRTEGAQ